VKKQYESLHAGRRVSDARTCVQSCVGPTAVVLCLAGELE